MSKQPEFSIQKIYLKDMSFESPGSPAVFLEEWKPVVDIDFNIQNTALDGDNHQVELLVTLNVKLKDKTIFIVETKEAGIFLLKNIPESDVEPILKGVCPNILFPYVRQRISQVIADGGYPPLYLAPINFEAIYAQKNQPVSNAN